MSPEKPEKKQVPRQEGLDPDRLHGNFPKGINTKMERRLYLALLGRHNGGSSEDPLAIITIARTLPSDQIQHPMLKNAVANVTNIPIVADEFRKLAKGKTWGIRDWIRSKLEALHLWPKHEEEKSELEEEDEEEQHMY
ncbi:MAG: hypothetical protein ABIA92_02950 [Patescibacteria group bacterium]